jgi:hypothetical protein
MSDLSAEALAKAEGPAAAATKADECLIILLDSDWANTAIPLQ